MPHASPEQMVHNWEQDYERKHTEVTLEVDTLHQTLQEQLEILSGEHAVIYDWFSKYVEAYPWKHFGHNQHLSHTTVRGADKGRSYDAVHKLHAIPVPLTDERGRINPNIQIQPYATIQYDSRRKIYDNRGYQKLGWQIIEKPEVPEDSSSGKTPVIIDSKEIVHPKKRFADFLKGEPYIRFRNDVETRGGSVRPIYEKSSFVVMDETSEDRLGLLAGLRSFQAMHITSIEHEMAQHAGVQQLIESGMEALRDVGVDVPQEAAS